MSDDIHLYDELSPDEERESVDHLLRCITAVAICLSDWGAAASHMAFDQIQFKPFYGEPVPLMGDVWHVVAGFRYIALALLAMLVFRARLIWYVATCFACWLGWQLLKLAHGKDWGWGVWERWL